MSNRYWSKWGDEDGQTVGFDGTHYYVQGAGGQRVYSNPAELDDMAYKILEVKRKVEGE